MSVFAEYSSLRNGNVLESAEGWGKMFLLAEMDTLVRSLRQVAGELGFSACRVSRSGVASGADAYLKWLEKGFHAGMDWLARSPERRCDTGLVLEGCRSVVMLALDYGLPPGVLHPSIAHYAQGVDYHRVIEARLADLDVFLQQYGGVQRCYVDSGPVLERDFARGCGVGWRGKNGLIVRESGSRFFLASMLTTLDLPPDDAVPSRCGSCRRCVESCPTGALRDDGALDASRCISYLTIENKGGIPAEFRPLIGGRIYGCDSCQDCCPWNRRDSQSGEPIFKSSRELRLMKPSRMLLLNEGEFLRLFRLSPIRRIKLSGLQRNVCVALGNTGDADDLPALEEFCRRGSLFSDHASWAIDRIRARMDEK